MAQPCTCVVRAMNTDEHLREDFHAFAATMPLEQILAMPIEELQTAFFIWRRSHILKQMEALRKLKNSPLQPIRQVP